MWLRRMRQEDRKFKDSRSNLASPCLKKIKRVLDVARWFNTWYQGEKEINKESSTPQGAVAWAQ